ncbi:MAG TPA: DUF411 domain-containing protein [Azospirillum sp.]|nr:DUF411 domain-containing protein [Azospirillum sp.]
MTMSRRTLMTALLGTVAAGGALTLLRGMTSPADAAPAVTVWKAESCGCCGGWVDHMRKAGFPVTVHVVDDVDPVKARLGVPERLQSCHTAEVGGYVLEGHVPADSVARLLRERPAAKGLAVPGMPQGSPGMETGTKDPYQVVLFGGSLGTQVFETR